MIDRNQYNRILLAIMNHADTCDDDVAAAYMRTIDHDDIANDHLSTLLFADVIDIDAVSTHAAYLYDDGDVIHAAIVLLHDYETTNVTLMAALIDIYFAIDDDHAANELLHGIIVANDFESAPIIDADDRAAVLAILS